MRGDTCSAVSFVTEDRALLSARLRELFEVTESTRIQTGLPQTQDGNHRDQKWLVNPNRGESS